MTKLLECVPNYSEGRDRTKIEKIVECFRGKQGVKLLDYSSDEDHNRTVVTVIGEPGPLREAVVASAGAALSVIDMTKHRGQHPRMGAVDVVPFIPVRNATVEDADALAKATAKEMAERYRLPIFLYEQSASAPHRVNLADVRRGQFEGMAEKMKDLSLWKPDVGPETMHPTGGVTAVGARPPLVAFNVNLATDSMDIATKIVHAVRFINGGFRYCKAMPVELKERGIVQVSMNLTDYSKTAVYRVFEAIRTEAKRYGVAVVGSEVIGLVPMQALIDCAEYYLQIENFSADQVLENRLL